MSRKTTESCLGKTLLDTICQYIGKLFCVCVFWRVGLQNDIENDSIYNIQSKGNNEFYKSHNMEQHNEIFVLACWVLPKKDEI